MPQHSEIFSHCPRPKASQPARSVTGVPIRSPAASSPPMRRTQTQVHEQHPLQATALPTYKLFPSYQQSQPHSSQVQVISQPSAMVEVLEFSNAASPTLSEDDMLSEASPLTTFDSTIAVVNGSKPRSTPGSGEERLIRDDVPDADLEPCSEIEIHPQGNLVLMVGEKSTQTRSRRIIVQADTMKNFGPRWKEVIDDSERESLLSRRRVLPLPFDDADMMLVLMWLSHVWHIRKVPKLLSFKQLLAMTSLCDKYEMNSQVAPYIQAWIAPHQGKLLSPGREQWLAIASQFGLERHYATLARHLVLHCQVNVEGTLLIPGRRETLPGRISQEAYNEIRHKRIKALAIFFNIVYEVIDAMENGDSCRVGMPQSPFEDPDIAMNHERTTCTHTNHGELIRYLKTYNYWPPVTKAQVIPLSVNEVYERLAAVPSIRYRPLQNSTASNDADTADTTVAKSSPFDRSAGTTHDACDISKVLATMLYNARERLEIPMAESTIEHLRQNAVASGIKSEAKTED